MDNNTHEKHTHIQYSEKKHHHHHHIKWKKKQKKRMSGTFFDRKTFFVVSKIWSKLQFETQLRWIHHDYYYCLCVVVYIYIVYFVYTCLFYLDILCTHEHLVSGKHVCSYNNNNNIYVIYIYIKLNDINCDIIIMKNYKFVWNIEQNVNGLF